MLRISQNNTWLNYSISNVGKCGIPRLIINSPTELTKEGGKDSILLGKRHEDSREA